jgi:catalase
VARTKKSTAFRKLDGRGECSTAGARGATHQSTDAAEVSLTTNQGVTVADNHDMLKSRERGPSLPKDFAFGEKINHFDDEGVIELDARASVGQYIEAANRQRVWDRESRLSVGDA